MTDHIIAEYLGKQMHFISVNPRTRWRVQTLATKEPWTFRWLESLGPEDVLWDIGANIGVYTIFAAVARGALVRAFEPESQNFALLCANIAANPGCRAMAYPLAISDKEQLDALFLSEMSVGQSCHSFAQEVGPYLEPRPGAFAQGCMATTVDELAQSYGVPMPTHIKVDVDGFEHLVVKGAQFTLREPALRSVIIETNPHIPAHNLMVQWMQEAGFTFDPAQVQESTRTAGDFAGVAEYIFTRKEAV